MRSGHFVPVVVPGRAVRQQRRDVLTERLATCRPGGAEAVI